MPQLIYDKLNDFGSLTAAGDFPNTSRLGDEAISRNTVDQKTPAGPVTGSVTLTVKGSATEAGTYTAIVVSGAVSAAQLAAGYRLPVPATAFKFIKAAIAGTFTGTVQAIVNSYLGK
jgi:hypothetical protein